jgi:predicted permease
VSAAPRKRFTWPWRSAAGIRDDLEAELALHHELRAEELVASGLSPEEAEAAARREAGDLDDARQYVAALDGRRELARRRRERIADFGADVRRAFRRLRRAPLFTLTAVGTLAIGIGACTFMFSIVAGVLLTPPPLRKPDRAVMVWGYYPQVDLGFEEHPLHGRQVAAVRELNRTLEAVAGFRPRAFNLGERGAPERVDGTEITAGFFEAIGVEPQLGRFPDLADEARRERLVVLSDALWRRRFGGDPAAVGRTLSLNGEPYLISGVAPPGFGFPRGAEMPGNFQFPPMSELWVPIEPPQRGPSDMAGVARLLPGTTYESAVEDLARITAVLEERMPQGKGYFNTRLVPLQRQVSGAVAPTLLMLLAAVGLVLLVASLNTAQLFLARNQGRRRDLAIRAALGASGGRLTREILAEVLLVVAAAGAVGTGLGAAAVAVARLVAPVMLPRLADVAFDLRSGGGAVLVTLLAAAIAALLPLLGGRRESAAEAMRLGARGAGGGGQSGRARQLLVVTELALSMVLVAGAGLLVRSLGRQLGSPAGFEPAHGTTFEVTLPPLRYTERQFTTYMEHPAAVAFLAEVLARLRTAPGIDAAAIGKPLPLSGAQEASAFTAEGIETAPGTDSVGTSPPMAEYTVASDGMLRALGTPLLAGRDFDARDTETSPAVVIVNQSMAARLWPGESALGRRLHLGGPTAEAPWMTVIGVVADLKRYALTEVPRPEMIVPYTQRPYPSFLTMQFVVRSRLAPEAMLAAARRVVAEVDPAVPISKVRTLDDLIDDSTVRARLAARIVTAFGGVALGLAMVGLYGVIAYSVYQRRQEFGVRRALGATQAGIVRLVLREGMRLSIVGVLIGLGGALLAGRWLRHELYEISPFDPTTLTLTAALLAAAAAAACVVPAGRASRVEPRVALED